MGTTHSDIYSERSLETFSQSHKFLKQINDERFGIAEIWEKTSDSSKVLVIAHNFPIESEFSDFYKELLYRSRLTHDNLLNFIGFCELKSSNLCSDSRKLVIYVEYSSLNLK